MTKALARDIIDVNNLLFLGKMWFKVWRTRTLIIFLQLIAVATILFIGRTEIIQNQSLSPDPATTTWSQINQAQVQLEKTQVPASPSTSSPIVNLTTAGANYRPNYEISWANPTNYGERFSTDINGRSVSNQPIIVLHETVNSASSAINFFQTPHTDEKKQASYHTLIKLDGTIIYIIPPEKRAFGAANSVFVGTNGAETVKTHPDFPASVNNFAYHVAFETPVDGQNQAQTHSGYTDIQYRSLAWLIAQSSVTEDRITTHRAVDRSGNRIDPRSFNRTKLIELLHSHRQTDIKKVS